MKYNDCIFCNPEKSYIIKETKLAIAVYFPRAIKKGHFAVAIKEHLPTFSEISPAQAQAVIELALEVSKVMEEKLKSQKTYITAIGDKDLHFHMHLLPKLESDTLMGSYIMGDMGWKKEVGQDFSEQEVQELISEIKSCL